MCYAQVVPFYLGSCQTCLPPTHIEILRLGLLLEMANVLDGCLNAHEIARVTG